MAACLLGTGTVLGTGNTRVTKTGKETLMERTFKWGRAESKQIIN